MIATLTTTSWPAAPEAWLALSACLILMMDVYGGDKHRGLTATATMLALLIGVLLTSSFGMVLQHSLLFNGLYVADALGTFLKLAGFVAMPRRYFIRRNTWNSAACWAGNTTFCASRACSGCSC